MKAVNIDNIFINFNNVTSVKDNPNVLKIASSAKEVLSHSLLEKIEKYYLSTFLTKDGRYIDKTHPIYVLEGEEEKQLFKEMCVKANERKKNSRISHGVVNYDLSTGIVVFFNHENALFVSMKLASLVNNENDK